MGSMRNRKTRFECLSVDDIIVVRSADLGHHQGQTFPLMELHGKEVVWIRTGFTLDAYCGSRIVRRRRRHKLNPYVMREASMG